MNTKSETKPAAPTSRPASAATDVAEFVTDLDGGQFEQMLSTALSRVAAAVVDHERKGKVTVVFDITKIPGTHQVRVNHGVKYANPTALGAQSEEIETSTVLHVGKGGAMSISQAMLFGKQAEI
jgi:ribosomal protein L21